MVERSFRASPGETSNSLSMRLNKWNPTYPQLGPTLTEEATASLSDDCRWEVNYKEKRQRCQCSTVNSLSHILRKFTSANGGHLM